MTKDRLDIPDEIDKKVSTLFNLHTPESYRDGFEILRKHISTDDAIFTTFCYWLWDEETSGELVLGNHSLRLIEKTFLISFGKDYMYKVSIHPKVFDIDFGELFVGKFSRYRVGCGHHLQSCVEEFAERLGRYDRQNITFDGCAVLLHIYDVS